MLVDYHMHFEFGSYDEEWVKGFFEAGKKRDIEEWGVTEHSHGFTEFKEFYYDDLILDESKVGKIQTKMLLINKFKTGVQDYIDFMNLLKSKGYPVKTGIEVCNFQDQKKVREILDQFKFDYIIGSVHFIEGWAFDTASIKDEWENHSYYDIYERYTIEVEKMAYSGNYDVLGHPFNVRLFNNIPKEDVSSLIDRIIKALKDNNMAVDVNTGTVYRYPIKEITPYPEFMKKAYENNIPVILSSDAHRPKDSGNYIREAADYIKDIGYTEIVTFENREMKFVKI